MLSCVPDILSVAFVRGEVGLGRFDGVVSECIFLSMKTLSVLTKCNKLYVSLSLKGLSEARDESYSLPVSSASFIFLPHHCLFMSSVFQTAVLPLIFILSRHMPVNNSLVCLLSTTWI